MSMDTAGALLVALRELLAVADTVAPERDDGETIGDYLARLDTYGAACDKARRLCRQTESEKA